MQEGLDQGVDRVLARGEVTGVQEDPVVGGWNPFIGAFAAETAPPSRLAELLAE